MIPSPRLNPFRKPSSAHGVSGTEQRRWRRAALAAALLVQAMVGVFVIGQQPLFEYQTDEVGHLNTARFIAQEGRPPEAGSFAWTPETLQFSQPPLQYYVMAPLVLFVDDGS